MSQPGPASARFNQDLMNAAWAAMESLFSNADRASWNAGGDSGYTPNSTYADAYADRGAPPALAQGLGFYSQMMEPDLLGILGELTGLAGLGRAAPDAPRVPTRDVVRGADGLPITAFRAEAPGGGRGPIAADLDLPQGNARYYGTPEYVEGLSHPGFGDNLVREGNLRARPGGVLDAYGGDIDPDLMDRVRDAALQNLEGVPAEMIRGAFAEYRQGTRTLDELLADLRHQFGNDLGPVPEQAGLDVLLQHADDGKNRRGGMEAVAFGPGTWQDTNVYGPGEFSDYMRARGR